MPTVHGPGVRTHWELSGPEGAPVHLLIRGLSRSSRYWLGLRPALEATRRVLVLDNRGVGRTEIARPFFSIEDMADDVARVMDAARIERAHVFGLSLGGMIAMRLAIRHPSRLASLVLGATTAGGRRRVPIAKRTLLSFLRTARMSTEEAMRFTAPLTLAPGFAARHPEIVDAWVGIAKSEPRRRLALLGQLLAAARHDAANELASVRAPTLVVTGDADTLMPPANSHAIAEGIGGAELRILPGRGHDFATESPDEIAALLIEWADRHAI
jgi:pimeloyl-ACP methyl ester carboxylesterase